MPSEAEQHHTFSPVRGGASLALRAAAVAIAILGAIDPAITLARRARMPLIIAADGAHGAALASAGHLQQLVQDAYDVRVRWIGGDRRLPVCSAEEQCVLVGGERWPRDAIDPRARVLAAIRVKEAAGPRVEIERVTSPTMTHATAAGRLLVELAGREVAGTESTIDVFDGDVPVGRARHAWTDDGSVTIPVDWWPLAAGLRHLSVRVAQAGGQARSGGGHRFSGALGTDRIDVGIEVETAPYNVLIYDPRPSWTSTFVRRAIEGDARVALRTVAGISPRAQVTEGPPFRLDEATLTDASAVSVGAPEELSRRDVDVLERFVRVRGGTLILVPDRRPSGPIVRLLPSPVSERLESSPVQVGAWRASELLVFADRNSAPATSLEVLAAYGAGRESSERRAIVVAAPRGAGRIIVSGVMDAWRYRDMDDGAFDRGWRSLVADAAAAGGRALEVVLDRHLAGPGRDVRVTVVVRAMAPPEAAAAVSATATCGEERPRVVRLWPTGDRRRFEGRFVPAAPGTCEVEVSSSAPVAAKTRTRLLVRHDIRDVAVSLKVSDPSVPRSVPRTDTTDALARDFRATVFNAGDEIPAARDLRRRSTVEMTPSEVRPMRSPWWIVPFAACLGAEWWLRRRHGMR